jgi:HK97 gp10 family phage protein
MAVSNLNFGVFSHYGFEEYLQKVQAIGNDIEEAAIEAINESVKPVQAEIDAWAAKHKLTGATSSGLVKPEAKISGNIVSAAIGVTGEGESWHAVFPEYGTPRMQADPGIRPAIENNMAKMRRIQREVLIRRGMPID